MGRACPYRPLSREAAGRKQRRCGHWQKPRRQPRPRPRPAAARQTARAALLRGMGRILGTSPPATASRHAITPTSGTVTPATEHMTAILLPVTSTRWQCPHAGAEHQDPTSDTDAQAQNEALIFPCRLQPPNPEERTLPKFKPGTSTWNTDDPSQAPPWVRAQVRPAWVSSKCMYSDDLEHHKVLAFWACMFCAHEHKHLSNDGWKWHRP